MNSIILDVSIESRKILFEDISKEGVEKQIVFTGVPFIIMGMKRLDCTHGVDRCISTKLKRKEKKMKEVISASYV